MPLQKKRKVLDGFNGKTRPKKKFRKQTEYHSSSEDEEEPEETGELAAVNLADSDAESGSEDAGDIAQDGVNLGGKGKSSKQTKAEINEDGDESEENDDEDSDAESDASTSAPKAPPKRNDPSAFSTSISKILSTKLPSAARADPVLSRSKSAAQTGTEVADERLDNQARAKLRAEKKEELDRGRVRDVMGLETGQAGVVAEEEKRLRKIGQRGVVKLFNAVRAAQVRGEEAAKQERKKGTIGIGEREKNTNEVSKQGFMELISGKKGKPLNIEEA